MDKIQDIIAPSNSEKPAIDVNSRVLFIFLVLLKSGIDIAIPSGILCIAIAKANEMPNFIS